ncbi:MAG: T9SS type A sorting domain-containing protein, partial [Bacteroidetes bacterium]|nr:T9SS type A sorting domain-containing protein [Bacteroidota bacterium]
CVARLDSTPSTWTETSTIINNGDVSIAAGLCNGAPGEFWAAEWYFAGEVSDIILLKGTWNNSTNDIDWVEETVLTVPYDFGLGSSVGTSLNMAFDKTGQLGYVAFLGDICDDATFQYSPVFFKTIDGGINWEGPIELDLGKFANVVAVVDTPTTAFEADLVVDYKGDPHLGVVIGGATAQDYTINTVNLAMFDFTYSSDDSAWIAIKLDTVGVLRSDVIVGANGIGHDNRPVGVVDSSGEKVFFFWADADNGSVPYRDLMGAGIDVKNRIVTNPVNFTKGDATWGGKAFFHTAAATSLYAGTTHTIPVVVTVAGSAFDQPAYFHYLSDITFDDSDFSVAWDTSQAVTTTISAAFTMILNANRLVQFLDNTAGATSWKWDFGDATFSPIANPSHTYLNSGTYTVCLTVGSCASFDNDSTCQDITVTGINDPDLNNHVNLFPNPSTGEFFIQLNLLNMDKVDLVVYNAHGLLISANEDIQIALGDMVKLDLTDQANGIYFVQISGEFGIITQKLSITR